MAPKFHLGWKRQSKDHRDWRYQPPRRFALTLTPTVDLTAGMGPQLNQGSLGSCGPNTADEMITYDQKVEGLPLVAPSRLFIYYTTRDLMGIDPSTQVPSVDEDSGVDNRTLLKALAQFGFCPESLWPYGDGSTFKQKPSPAAYAAALPNIITSYAAIDVNLQQMQACLASRFPFMFGFDVFDQIQSDAAAATGILTDPAPTDTPIGGHDVTICGYTTVQLPGINPGNYWPANTFRFRNHWLNQDGSPWGDGGYGYVSFKYATGPNASDFWVINAVPGGAPASAVRKR
jgi:C1A family cysteine protease